MTTSGNLSARRIYLLRIYANFLISSQKIEPHKCELRLYFLTVKCFLLIWKKQLPTGTDACGEPWTGRSYESLLFNTESMSFISSVTLMKPGVSPVSVRVMMPCHVEFWRPVMVILIAELFASLSISRLIWHLRCCQLAAILLADVLFLVDDGDCAQGEGLSQNNTCKPPQSRL